MNTATIRQRLHGYLETADEKKVKAIYTMVEDEINQQHGFVLSKEQIGWTGSVQNMWKEQANHIVGTKQKKSYLSRNPKSKLKDKK